MAFGLVQAMLNLPSDPSDATNVFIIAGEGNLSLLQTLLPPLPNGVNHGDDNGYTCLHAASSYNQQAVLTWLLDNNANVNGKDNDGDTPLHHCECKSVAEFLISKGGDVNIRNNEGKTPLNSKMNDLILESHEDYDEDDEENNTLKELVDYLKTFAMSINRFIAEQGEENVIKMMAENQDMEDVMEEGDESDSGDKAAN